VNVGMAQVVKGKVYDKKTKQVLFFANLTFTDSLNKEVHCETNLDGEYTIDLQKFGIYRVFIKAVGYNPNDTLIVFTKNDFFTFDFKLDSDEITAAGFYIIITEKPYQSGDLTMTQNQYKVMPASFQDPARILIKYPGFSTPNDGANAIIFRGMPPETARWQLFGADIVNPNHLSNAGTANDLATGNAGGVNALSGSVLDYYHFEANPADVSYSNVMSGVSNMKMAPKIKSFIDINLIGLEAGLGFRRGIKNYYGSYRYSFVGLLDKLGVNFGNEKIGYQDFSIYGDIIKDGNNSLKIFGTYGTSKNILNSVSPTDTISKVKDLQNIRFNNDIGIFGLDFTHITEQFSDRFHSTLVASFLENSRNEATDDFWSEATGIDIQSQNSTRQGLISSHTSFSNDEDEDLRMAIGLRMNYHFNHYTQNTIDIDNNNYFSIYNYLKFDEVKFKKWPIVFDFGSGLYFDTRTKKMTSEPSMSAKYAISEKSKLTLDYRYAGFDNYSSPFIITTAMPKTRIMGHHLQLTYELLMGKSKWNTQFFYHHFNDVSNLAFTADTSVVLNIFNGPAGGYDFISGEEFLFKNQTSIARVFGMSADWNSNFNNQWNIQINGSIFRSQYSLPENESKFYNGRYNFGFTTGAMISYAKNYTNSDRDKTITCSVSSHLRGGQREQNLSSNISHVYDYSSTFRNRLRPYARVDFRIVYTSRKSGSKKTHRWSLDIQNLLNRENDGFRYYDPLLKSVLLQKQLGLVPVLSYRLEW